MPVGCCQLKAGLLSFPGNIIHSKLGKEIRASVAGRIIPKLYSFTVVKLALNLDRANSGGVGASPALNIYWSKNYQRLLVLNSCLDRFADITTVTFPTKTIIPAIDGSLTELCGSITGLHKRLKVVENLFVQLVGCE